MTALDLLRSHRFLGADNVASVVRGAVSRGAVTGSYSHGADSTPEPHLIKFALWSSALANVSVRSYSHDPVTAVSRTDSRARCPNRKKGIMRKALAGFATGLMMAGLTVGGAGSAQAASHGNVYLVVNDRACGSPQAKVRGILGDIAPVNGHSTWSSRSWDFGDNIIYPKVRLGVKNVARLQLQCQVRRGFVWVPVGYRTLPNATFTPTKAGGTYWVG